MVTVGSDPGRVRSVIIQRGSAMQSKRVRLGMAVVVGCAAGVWLTAGCGNTGGGNGDGGGLRPGTPEERQVSVIRVSRAGLQGS
jgi:hypothetical protein